MRKNDLAKSRSDRTSVEFHDWRLFRTKCWSWNRWIEILAQRGRWTTDKNANSVPFLDEKSSSWRRSRERLQGKGGLRPIKATKSSECARVGTRNGIASGVCCIFRRRFHGEIFGVKSDLDHEAEKVKRARFDIRDHDLQQLVNSYWTREKPWSLNFTKKKERINSPEFSYFLYCGSICG